MYPQCSRKCYVDAHPNFEKDDKDFWSNPRRPSDRMTVGGHGKKEGRSAWVEDENGEYRYGNKRHCGLKNVQQKT